MKGARYIGEGVCPVRYGDVPFPAGAVITSPPYPPDIVEYVLRFPYFEAVDVDIDGASLPAFPVEPSED